jgi:hypothetical protein
MEVRDKRQDCICGLGRNREELTSIQLMNMRAQKGTRQNIITGEREFGDAQAAWTSRRERIWGAPTTVHSGTFCRYNNRRERILGAPTTVHSGTYRTKASRFCLRHLQQCKCTPQFTSHLHDMIKIAKVNQICLKLCIGAKVSHPLLSSLALVLSNLYAAPPGCSRLDTLACRILSHLYHTRKKGKLTCRACIKEVLSLDKVWYEWLMDWFLIHVYGMKADPSNPQDFFSIRAEFEQFPLKFQRDPYNTDTKFKNISKNFNWILGYLLNIIYLDLISLLAICHQMCSYILWINLIAPRWRSQHLTL